MPKLYAGGDRSARDQEILSRLDLWAEAERLGLRFAAAEPESGGWLRCHAINRDDRNPSASFHVRTGRYRDHAGEGEGLSFFDLAARLLNLPDWRAARDRYAAEAGLTPTTDDRPAAHSGPHQPRQRLRNPTKHGANGGSVDGDAGKRPGRAFPNADAARAALERKHGPAARVWTYHDSAGEAVGLTLRWDHAAGDGEKGDGRKGDKTIRPASKHSDGWRLAAMPTPRPVYALPDLVASRNGGRVYVCEGEKAADAVRTLGLTATASAGGSKAARKTDWTPLAGREVVILPDADEPGRDYAAAVAGILTTLDPPTAVRLLDLPGLPPKGDAADWRDANPEDGSPAGRAALANRLNALADAAPPWTPAAGHGADDGPQPTVPPWRPFPLDSLPPAVAAFIAESAAGIGCDAAFVALPLLAALAAAVGNARRVRLRRGWPEPAIVWAVTIGESGSHKSPGFNAALSPVFDRQRKAMKLHAEAFAAYEADRAASELARKTVEKKPEARSERTPPPAPPAEPVLASYWIDDTTIEAVGKILADNPRGTLCAVEELAAWFGAFDRYAKSGKGGDAPKWLRMHGGGAVRIDRKNGSPRTLLVPRAAISVTGTIQPGTLRRMLGDAEREGGLAARLFFACPPRRPKRWTDAELSPAAEAALADLFARLWALELGTDAEGDPAPIDLPLTADAKAAFERFVNEHGEEHAELSGDLAAAWSKLEGGAARLALVVHLCRAVAGDADPSAVDAVSVAAGVTLARWFAAEARRVYALLAEDSDARDLRSLAEWIGRKHGGEATARQVQAGRRELRTAADAEAALAALADAGFGRWIDRPTDPAAGGRPTRAFRLHSLARVYETPATPGVEGVPLTLTPQARPKTPPVPVPAAAPCTAPGNAAADVPDDDWETV